MNTARIQKRKLEEPIPGQLLKCGEGSPMLTSVEDRSGETAITRAKDIQTRISKFQPAPKNKKDGRRER